MRANRGLNFLIYWWLMVLGSCTLLAPTTASSTYDEDLSAHRPQVPIGPTETEETPEKLELENVAPTNDQAGEIDQRINQISTHNATSRTAPGFTIQVYSGTSREKASEAKTQVYKILPDSRPETKYEQPIYRVRVGEFGDRLEAQNVYAQLLKEFPQAIVIPSRIRIN